MESAVKETMICSRRILRLALGTALSMAFSQAVDWPLSFIAPLFTALLLSMPVPRPSVKGGLVFVTILMSSVLGATELLPYVYYAPAAGVLLLALGLFFSFFITASGGPVIIGTFLTLALSLVTTIGSISIDFLIEAIKGLASGSLVGFVFVWIVHAILPDYPIDNPQHQANVQKEKPDKIKAVASAMRSLVIVYPVMFLFLCLDTSASYTVIMIKVASMGQQASSEKSYFMGDMLLKSTFWGGLGAVCAWAVLYINPSLVMYSLLIGLACLLYGRGIFKAGGLHPQSAMWGYALITMIVVLAPTVGSMASGQSSAERFWLRLVYFFVVAFYGWFAVAAFDTFSRSRKGENVEKEKSLSTS